MLLGLKHNRTQLLQVFHVLMVGKYDFSSTDVILQAKMLKAHVYAPVFQIVKEHQHITNVCILKLRFCH